ncbi:MULTISPECIES: hypothetical protein [Amycolatopsis]|uniref:Luciferase-like monooxygenase n=2 Tax=Amycolatopsis TaxID=1813 RepID=A0A1I4D695_9PSEU|nr:hypothetical protein [Amycolatopsis sacchari]SFK87676.1 Luciferase-like monooxygenase [Amycolatopsis sacchari]
MKIGITLPNLVGGTREIPGWAATAEEAGFASLGTAGRFAYPAVSDTVALAAAAAVTERIVIAPGWPAALLAKEVAGSTRCRADG